MNDQVTLLLPPFTTVSQVCYANTPVRYDEIYEIFVPDKFPGPLLQSNLISGVLILYENTVTTTKATKLQKAI